MHRDNSVVVCEQLSVLGGHFYTSELGYLPRRWYINKVLPSRLTPKNNYIRQTQILLLLRHPALRRYGQSNSNITQGDYHIAEVINDTFSLTDAYNYGNHTAPKPDITNSLTLLGYDTDQSTYLTVKYERLLDTGDSEDTVLVRGSTIKLSYAYRPGSKKLTYHQSNHNTITGTV